MSIGLTITSLQSSRYTMYPTYETQNCVKTEIDRNEFRGIIWSKQKPEENSLFPEEQLMFIGVLDA